MSVTRISKLQRALELCSSLISVLGDIGPCNCKGDKEADIFDTDAHKMQKELDRMLATVSRLRNKNSSTIYRLPDEVLSYIFQVPYTQKWSPSSIPNFAETISQVSHWWRSVAVETPQLWTTIVAGHKCCKLGLCLENKCRLEGHLARVHMPEVQRTWTNTEWVYRAKTIPLTLQISHDAEQEFGNILRTVHNGMDLGMTRVRKLSLSLDSPGIANLVHQLVAHCKDTLEVLHLDGQRTPFHQSWSGLAPIFRIRMLYLKEISLLQIPIPERFEAFEQCTKLSLSKDVSDYTARLIPLLQRCPDLQSLEIRPMFRDMFPNPNTPTLDMSSLNRISLPSLKRLILDEGRAEPTGALCALALPNLEELSIGLTTLPRDPTAGETIQNALTALRELLLTTRLVRTLRFLSSPIPLQATIDTRGLSDVLQATPRLLTLAFPTYMREEHLGALNRVLQGSSVVCPELECLEIDVSMTRSLSHVFHFIKERFLHPSCANIRVLKFSFSTVGVLRERLLPFLTQELRTGYTVGIETILCNDRVYNKKTGKWLPKQEGQKG